MNNALDVMRDANGVRDVLDGVKYGISTHNNGECNCVDTFLAI